MGRNRKALTQDVGDSGILDLKWGGVVRDDYLREWNLPQKAKTVDEMLRNSSVVGALRFAIEMSIQTVQWWFESDQGEEDPRLEFCKESLGNLNHNWSAHISDALLCIFYGWSMFSITYEQKNGNLLWRKFKPLKHTTLMRWLYSEDGSLEGIKQWPTDWPEPIPIERMVIYKIRSNFGSPEGESILRPAYPDYYYAKNFKSLEGIAFERNGAGYPSVTLPEGADTQNTGPDSDIGRATAMVRNVRNDEQSGLVLPFGWNFEFKSTGNVLDFSEPISRYEKRILTAALAQFLVLGQDRVGAMSLSTDLSNFFNMAVNALCDIIADTFSQYAVKRLLTLNGFDPDGITLQHSPAGDSNMVEMADFLQKVLPSINWTAQDEVWIRSIGGMPERSVEDIQADMETGAARSAEIAGRMAQARQIQPQPPMMDEDESDDEGDDDQLNADLYAMPTDNATREKIERQWAKRWESWFDDQQERVIRGARELTNA